MEKMTKKDYFETLKGFVAGNDELVAFLDRQIELVSKKRTGETKTQKENKEIVENIYNYMVNAGAPVTVADIMENCGIVSSQKASALVKKLVDTNRVTRGKDGKKTIYAIAE
jgi:predicted transcriptional regulator